MATKEDIQQESHRFLRSSLGILGFVLFVGAFFTLILGVGPLAGVAFLGLPAGYWIGIGAIVVWFTQINRQNPKKYYDPEDYK